MLFKVKIIDGYNTRKYFSSKDITAEKNTQDPNFYIEII